MSDLPNGWASTTLRDVTSPQNEKADPSTLGDSRFVGMDHIEAHTSRLLATQPVRELKSAVAVFKKGDILYGRLRPYLNKVYEAQFDGAASAEFIVIPPSPAIDQRFLAMRMRTPEFVALANQRSTGDRPRVTFESVSDFPIILPPLPEQRRIVAKLDNIFARTGTAREELDRIPLLIKHYKEAILTAAFSGELTRQWREEHGLSAPASLDRNDIDGRAADLNALPQGWKWTSFSRVAVVTGGLTKNAKRAAIATRVPYLRVANVYANELRLDDVAKIGCTDGELTKTRLRKGDLLIVEGNGSIEQIGRVAMWNEEIDNCSHQNHLIRVRTNKYAVPKFALHWLLSPIGRSAIENVASSSSGLHTLSISKVAGLPIPICNCAEQEKVVFQIETAFAWLDKVAIEQARAADLLPKLNRAILAKAFRGKLIPQDPTDEPAAAMLKRIRAGSQNGAARKRRRDGDALG